MVSVFSLIIAAAVVVFAAQPASGIARKGEPALGDEEEFGELVIPPGYPFVEPDSSRTSLLPSHGNVMCSAVRCALCACDLISLTRGMLLLRSR